MDEFCENGKPYVLVKFFLFWGNLFICVGSWRKLKVGDFWQSFEIIENESV